MKHTLVLYQNPIALGDVNNWIRSMEERGRLRSVSALTEPVIRAWVEGPEGEEGVVCIPIDYIINHPSEIPPRYDKLVLIGAIEKELRPVVGAFIRDY